MDVALTFDVESDFSLERAFNNIKDSLPVMLKVLNEENIKSTFFVTGKVLEEFGDEIIEMLKGHEIASHGYNHRRLDKLSRVESENEIRKSKIIFSEHGLEPIGFRAPKLCVNDNVLNFISYYYKYDSSIVPIAIPFRYFNVLKKRTPRLIKKDFLEIPIGTFNSLRIPAISSWMFFIGKKYINFLKFFDQSNPFVILFHSYDLVKYETPKGLPSYKNKLYYSRCGTDKLNFFKELIQFFKAKKTNFLTCKEIYETEIRS